MTKAKPTTVFETEVCGRCGGTGNYSYNQIDGTRCFGCHGSGWKLTARGSAARAWWKANFTKTVKATEVTVGMIIRGAGIKKLTVAEISPVRHGGSSLIDGVWIDYNVVTFSNAPADPNHRLGLVVPVNSDVEVIPTEAERVAGLNAAKEYQETLTVKGTPRKR